VLHNLQINFKLLWDFHQSLVKLAEHNRVKLIWMPRYMTFEVNETTEQ